MSSKSLNRVLLIGNVTRDPELRYTPQGNAVATFGLATNRSWKTDSGEIREEAEFHRLVAWNKLAELCSQLITRGRKIYVEGRLQTRTFTGSDNAQHTITEIVIDDMILLDSKFSTQGGSAAGGAGAGAGARATTAASTVTPTASELTEETSPKIETKDKSSEMKGKKKETKSEEKEAEEKEAKEPDSVKASPGEDVNVDDIPF